ncbi:MAG: hypothetical protein IJP69_05060 [Synergistaceae bacterium]|nr:hypothetical protein [Synergistaceae bacterium]
MRKYKFLAILAGLIFLFSGCGGSKGGDSTETVYDGDIERILTGTWKIASSTTGTATTPNGATTLTLTNPVQTEIIFSDLSLISNSASDNDASGTVYLYYYMNWGSQNSGVDAGTFDIRSYTDSNASDKRKLMDIVHSDVNEWVLTSRNTNSSDSDRISITLTLTGENEMTLNWSGNQYINTQKLRYNYSFEVSNRKSSTKTTPETVPDDKTTTENEQENVKTFQEILSGKWSVVNPYKKINVDFADGGAMLLISSDVTFSNINISGDTGTATVSMDQNWRVEWNHTIYVRYYDRDAGDYAYREETSKLIGFTAFSLRNKTINMTRNATNTGKWRCYFENPDATDSTEATIIKGTVMNVEITADNTITIVHEGIVEPPQEYLNDTAVDVKSNLIIYDQVDFDYIKK